MPNDDESRLPISSSKAPDIPAEQQRLFRDVLAHLTERGVPFIVAGAFALQEHSGICRFTKDLDLFVPAEHVQSALATLQAEGFQCEVTDPVWLAKAHRGEYFVDLITGMSNAVVIVDQSWVDRGTPARVFDVDVKVVAAEELIASKLFVTRRERFDGADIAHVFYCTRGKLDWSRLLQLVGEHWEMLLWDLILFHYVYPAHSHYVPAEVWQNLLARLHRAIEYPDPQAQFRGSLIDPKMFAIDVNEWGFPNLLEELRQRRQPKIASDPRAA